MTNEKSRHSASLYISVKCVGTVSFASNCVDTIVSAQCVGTVCRSCAAAVTASPFRNKLCYHSATIISIPAISS